ncbi:hypothetical protein [Methylorubrum salsuginis]|uniref:Uncharacterized protein n=1 Tax=Methylorubrum salsuginis TaxID=414703 RepID=A0A1I4HVC0_9HYPH|nr:hypothetical protein [Methylorubrum salsuginis]SFL45780.1 hypothetical protein SAMN04488125_11586 [Methylorubrum salsuginis]
MPSQDAEALAALARLCGEVRARLPGSAHHRLRVLLDMLLVDLAREGFCAEGGAQGQSGGETEPDLSRTSP